MAEQLDLTAPWGPQTSQWRVQAIRLERGIADDLTPLPMMSLLEIRLIGTNGQRYTRRWTGTQADTLLIALNKANLNPATGGQTLERRALNLLLQDGEFTGSISGAAD